MTKTAKVIVGVIVVVVIIVIIAASNSAPKETGPIKIGVIAPLTGDGAPYGESVKGGVELAVQQFNSTVATGSRSVQAIYEDGKCNGKDAVTAAQKLMNIDHVKYIVGLPCSGEVLGVLPVSDPAKVILMVQGSNPVITATGHYVFRTFPNDLLSSKIIAKHAIDKNFKNAVVITENTEYSVGMDKAFTDLYSELGGKVLSSEKYSSDTTDFRSIISKVKSLNPDMIFINSQVGANAVRIVNQIRELGIKAQLYTAFFSGDDFVKSGPSVHGIYVVDVPVLSSDAPGAIAFATAYNTLNGKSPAYPFFAAGAYDETNVLIQALKATGTNDVDATYNYLHNLDSYSGAMGTFHFDSKGDVVGVLPAMKQIVNNKIVNVNQ